MSTLVAYASLLCVAAGLVAGALALAVGRDFRTALRVALDFWVAAGLLRLSLPPGADQLLAAAAIIAVRQLVGWALRPGSGPRPRSRPGPGRGSPGPEPVPRGTR